jgi:hypothetical protein
MRCRRRSWKVRELDLRLLVDHRERLIRQRVALNNTLQWHLHDLWPELELPGSSLFYGRWAPRVARRLARAEQRDLSLRATAPCRQRGRVLSPQPQRRPASPESARARSQARRKAPTLAVGPTRRSSAECGRRWTPLNACDRSNAEAAGYD